MHTSSAVLARSVFETVPIDRCRREMYMVEMIHPYELQGLCQRPQKGQISKMPHFSTVFQSQKTYRTSGPHQIWHKRRRTIICTTKLPMKNLQIVERVIEKDV